MKRAAVMVVIGTAAVLLQACSSKPEIDALLVEVGREDLIFDIAATGEVEAATSTAITMPSSVFEPQTIEWMVEENQLVKKGQVVIRFDNTKYVHQSQQEKLEMDKADISLVSKEKDLNNEKNEIKSQEYLIREELKISEQYSVDDLRVFSRNEIIDAMKNMDYLKAKQAYTEWRNESHEGKQSSELSLLTLTKGQHSAKYNMYQGMMGKMEIRAPHDGLFVLHKNWRGEKARVGDTTWPGRKIASLPDLSQLQAKIYVLESEAAGIKLGQKVVLQLDAFPDSELQGQLIKVDSMAKPRSNDNPTKYFEAVVAIEANSANLRPGSQLKAKVLLDTKPDIIAVPNQSVYLKNSSYYVLVYEDGKWQEREVSIGNRSQSKTEILQGLTVGESVALVFPKEFKNGDS